MKTSIVLSAYCGEKYLRDQMESLVNQTQCPDELIVIDDCSPDDGRTSDIIDEYCKKYSFIKKITNQRNCGWAKSFMKGTTLVDDSIDIVFFCDQDDIWELTKIEHVSNLFANEKVNAVISGCQNFNSNLNELLPDKSSGILYDNKFSLNRRFMYAKGVGAAMALRKGFIDRYRPLWNETLGHDRFYQIIAIMLDTLYYYDEVTTYHRMHENNATGGRKYGLDFRIKGLEGNIELLKSMEDDNLLSQLTMAERRIVRGYLRFAKKRLLMLKNRSVIRWLGLAFADLRYYPTSRTWFGDLQSIRSKQL